MGAAPAAAGDRGTRPAPPAARGGAAFWTVETFAAANPVGLLAAEPWSVAAPVGGATGLAGAGGVAVATTPPGPAAAPVWAVATFGGETDMGEPAAACGVTDAADAL
jgi:hypothetical protein